MQTQNGPSNTRGTKYAIASRCEKGDAVTQEICRIISSRLKQSHKRQFNGEDWQFVANGLTEDLSDEMRKEVYNNLCSSPDPNCNCGFCATADWQD